MPSAYYDSPIGRITAESNGKAITRISFSESGATISGDTDDCLTRCLGQLDDYFAGRRQVFDLPLAQPGTVFQHAVWNELQNIGYGTTISYRTLSMRLGNPKNIRAAASANGRNQLAIVVPCHRVIGSDGSLVGYAGELWRKKWLLEHERFFAHGVRPLF